MAVEAITSALQKFMRKKSQHCKLKLRSRPYPLAPPKAVGEQAQDFQQTQRTELWLLQSNAIIDIFLGIFKWQEFPQ